MPSDAVPKVIHFVSCTQLTFQQADYIKVWALANPDYQVNLWVDDVAIIGQFIRKVLFQRLVYHIDKPLDRSPRDDFDDVSVAFNRIILEERKKFPQRTLWLFLKLSGWFSII